MKVVLIIAGWFFIALGVLGIFLPLLPTTIFLLMAAWCFARSSQRFHHWLLSHPRLGPFIEAWQSGRGLEQGLRKRIIICLWLSLGISMLITGFSLKSPWVLCIFPVIGIGVSYHLYSMPSYQASKTKPLNQADQT